MISREKKKAWKKGLNKRKVGRRTLVIYIKGPLKISLRKKGEDRAVSG